MPVTAGISPDLYTIDNPFIRSEHMIVIALLAVAILYVALPTIFNAIIRISSTPKDPNVGDITPISNAAHLHLQGRRALVVGGTRGVGRGIALTLSKGGASVTVVGRDTHKIVHEIQAIAPVGSDQVFTSYSADLSTVTGSRQLVETLVETEPQQYDYVFFTVGCWPTYNMPFTPDGIERVVALDLVSHHVIFTGLATHNMLTPGARVMNTIASTQNFPFQTMSRVQKRLVESTKYQRPGMIPFTLFPVAIAGDAWLREASKRFPDVKFVGMFPGIVSSDLYKSSFPRWIMPLIRAALWPIAISEEASGLAHVTVLVSTSVGRHGVTFFNHFLEGRKAHPVALDNDLSTWVFEWLETTSSSLRKATE